MTLIIRFQASYVAVRLLASDGLSAIEPHWTSVSVSKSSSASVSQPRTGSRCIGIVVIFPAASYSGVAHGWPTVFVMFVISLTVLAVLDCTVVQGPPSADSRNPCQLLVLS